MKCSICFPPPRGREALVVLLAASLGTPALAQVRWLAPVSGSFHDPTRWSGGAVPGTASHAVFGMNSSTTFYDVFFQSGVSTAQLSVLNNRPVLNLSGTTYQASSNVTVNAVATPANAPILTVRNGLLSSPQILIAQGSGNAGELRVEGPTAVVETPMLITAQSSSQGTIRVTDGGTLRFRAQTFGSTSGQARIELTDHANLSNFGTIPFSFSLASSRGSCVMNILSGSRFTLINDPQIRLAVDADSSAQVTVHGPGSSWNTGGDLFVGAGGNATVSVLDGGSLNVTRFRLGEYTTGTSSMLVSGSESRATVFADITIGANKAATLGVFSGARVIARPATSIFLRQLGTIAGNGVIEGGVQWFGTLEPRGLPAPAPISPGTLTILGSATTQTITPLLRIAVAGADPGSQYSQVVFSGGVQFDGALEFVAVPPFAFEPGQSYVVARYGSHSGEFAAIRGPAGVRFGTTYGTNSLTVDTYCAADWNASGTIASQDFFDFLEDFFKGDADVNGDFITDSQDFFDFITAFFTPCKIG